MKFKIQVINEKFKDETEVDIEKMFSKDHLSKIKYNLSINAQSEIGISISSYFADIIIDELKGFVND